MIYGAEKEIKIDFKNLTYVAHFRSLSHSISLSTYIFVSFLSMCDIVRWEIFPHFSISPLKLLENISNAHICTRATIKKFKEILLTNAHVVVCCVKMESLNDVWKFIHRNNK